MLQISADLERNKNVFKPGFAEHEQGPATTSFLHVVVKSIQRAPKGSRLVLLAAKKLELLRPQPLHLI